MDLKANSVAHVASRAPNPEMNLSNFCIILSGFPEVGKMRHHTLRAVEMVEK